MVFGFRILLLQSALLRLGMKLSPASTGNVHNSWTLDHRGARQRQRPPVQVDPEEWPGEAPEEKQDGPKPKALLGVVPPGPAQVCAPG